ncbi:hypothetical protein PHJA_002874200 [Phtheirospermum japonicum]|uniref:Uncharacterized protein n=1 Tax=Phtheirospermum japonicum TaxID=374723 RepID=A0A830D5F0_9LAMI|nr:hypothetical protein PHJA_002874200 [Phtheirospermum japonicum]
MAELKTQQFKNNGVCANSSSSKKSKSNNNGFSRKCACLVKEQRARLYILRRCATMLLCWYIHDDE